MSGENDNETKMKNITKIATTVGGLVLSEAGRKFLCGTYSDGTPRSLSDALNGEIWSPEERDKRIRKLNKNTKKKKKKGKLSDFNGGFRL